MKSFTIDPPTLDTFLSSSPRWNTLSRWTLKGNNSNTNRDFYGVVESCKVAPGVYGAIWEARDCYSHFVPYCEYNGGVGWVNSVHWHFHTRVMLRYCAFSCTSTHTSCYTTVRSLLLPHIRHDDNDDDDHDHDDDKYMLKLILMVVTMLVMKLKFWFWSFSISPIIKQKTCQQLGAPQVPCTLFICLCVFMSIPLPILVGGLNPSEKYYSVGMIIPNWMEQ